MTPRPRLPHLRDEDGLGLIELLIAMMILIVAILALVAAYSSGYVALRRATTVSSATLLADSQMERFRALRFDNISLNTTCGASCAQDSTYTSDAAYSATAQITSCGTTDRACLPTQTVTGPDGRSYRIDTFVNCETLSGGVFGLASAGSCAPGGPASLVKLVTVVVRKSTGTGDWVREQSAFNKLTGQ